MDKKLEVSKSAYIVLRGYLSKLDDPRFAKHFTPEKKLVLDAIFAAVKRVFKPKIYNHIPAKIFAKLIDIFGLQGLSDHYVLRKTYIQSKVEEALNSDITQVVNIGSGYDVLCLELSVKYPQAKFFELDITDSVEIKSLIAKDLLGQNFFNAKSDISKTSLLEVLASFPEYDKSQKTIFIIEGLLVYLDKEQVDKVFQELGRNAKDSKIVFTNVEEVAAKNKGFSVIKTFLKKTDEEVKFTINESDIKTLLSEHKINLMESKSYFEMQESLGKQGFAQSYTGKLIENLILSEID